MEVDAPPYFDPAADATARLEPAQAYAAVPTKPRRKHTSQPALRTAGAADLDLEAAREADRGQDWGERC